MKFKYNLTEICFANKIKSIHYANDFTPRKSKNFWYYKTVFIPTNKYPPASGWYFIFWQSPNTTDSDKCSLELACQPCNCYLLPINGSCRSNNLNQSLSLPSLVVRQYIFYCIYVFPRGIYISITPKYGYNPHVLSLL